MTCAICFEHKTEWIAVDFVGSCPLLPLFSSPAGFSCSASGYRRPELLRNHLEPLQAWLPLLSSHSAAIFPCGFLNLLGNWIAADGGAGHSYEAVPKSHAKKGLLPWPLLAETRSQQTELGPQVRPCGIPSCLGLAVGTDKNAPRSQEIMGKSVA